MTHQENSRESILDPGAFYSHVQQALSRKDGEGFSLVTLTLDALDENNQSLSPACLPPISPCFSSRLDEGEIFCTPEEGTVLLWVKGGAFDAVLFDAMLEYHELFHSQTETGRIKYTAGLAEAADTANPQLLLVRAKFAAQMKYKASLCRFNARMGQNPDYRRAVASMVEAAFARREFQMYLQPKFHMETEEIAGTEALARWNSPLFGLLRPSSFLELLEELGQTHQLDFAMVEAACLFLKTCCDQEVPVVPVTINFSLQSVSAPDFVDRLFQMVSSLGISAKLVEVGFPSQALTKDFSVAVEVANALKYLGFRISMASFGGEGANYQHLKDMPLDVIEIDKGFFNSSVKTDKGRIILSKLADLLNSLGLLSVMEGVETKDQAEFIRSAGGSLAQGYYYARPMPIAEYLEFMKNHLPHAFSQGAAPLAYQLPGEFQMDNWELYILGQNIDMGLVKTHLEGDSPVEYINDRALDYLGYGRKDFQEKFHNNFLPLIHPEDLPMMVDNAREMMRTGKPMKYQVRGIRKDGKTIVLQGRCSCVVSPQGRYVGIYCYQDVTEELLHTQALEQSLKTKITQLEETVAAVEKSQRDLRISEEKYRAIVEQSGDIIFDWDFPTDLVVYSDKYDKLFGRSPTGEQLMTGQRTRSRIHPDDLPTLEHWLQVTRQGQDCASIEFRLQTASGKYLWMRARATPIFDEAGMPIRAVGVFSNIDPEKQEMERLRMKSQLDPLTRLYNKGEVSRRIADCIEAYPNQPGAMFIIDVDNFKSINDNLGHQTGDTVLVEVAAKIRRIFRDADIVGRIGGDEIAVYAQGFLDQEALLSKAEQLIQTLRLSYSHWSISGSVGIALYPDHGCCFDELYRNADVALYSSKYGGKDQFTIYTPDSIDFSGRTPTPLDSEESLLNKYFQHDVMYHVFETLSKTTDHNQAIQAILEQVGQHFNVDRAYFLQFSQEGTALAHTYEYRMRGVSSQKHNRDSMDLSHFVQYIHSFHRDGISRSDDVATLPPDLAAAFRAQDTRSYLQSAVYAGTKLAGILGLDSALLPRVWQEEETANLAYLSRVLALYLFPPAGGERKP